MDYITDPVRNVHDVRDPQAAYGELVLARNSDTITLIVEANVSRIIDLHDCVSGAIYKRQAVLRRITRAYKTSVARG